MNCNLARRRRSAFTRAVLIAVAVSVFVCTGRTLANVEVFPAGPPLYLASRVGSSFVVVPGNERVLFSSSNALKSLAISDQGIHAPIAYDVDPGQQILQHNLTDDGQWGVFDRQQHLYGLPLDGSSPPQLISHPEVGKGFRGTYFADDGRRAVYSVTHRVTSGSSTSAGAGAIFSTWVDARSPALNLTGPITDNYLFGSPNMSADGTRVAFTRFVPHGATGSTLFTATTDGGPLIPITSAVDGRYIREAGLNLTPDGSRVVFVSNQDQVAKYELYSATAGSVGALTKLSGPLVAGGNVESNRITMLPDASRLIYYADQDTNDVVELFSVPIDGSEAPRKLNRPLAANEDADAFAGGVSLLHQGASFFYITSERIQNRYVTHLHVTPTDGSTPSVELAAIVRPGGGFSVSDFAITADEQRLVYRTDADSNGKFEYFTRTIDGVGTPVRIGGSATEFSTSSRLFLSPDSDNLLILEDGTGTVGDQLYRVSLTSPEMLSQPLMTNSSQEPFFVRFNSTGDRFAIGFRHNREIEPGVFWPVLSELAVGTADGNSLVTVVDLRDSGTIGTYAFVGDRLLVAGDFDGNGKLKLAQMFADSLAGDFNADGHVDSADYTIWRNSFGQVGAGLAADGTGPIIGQPDGVVDQLDFELWKSHFGLSTQSSGFVTQQAVPELLSWHLAVLAGACFAVSRPISRRG